jgi:hypothetical protein
VTTATGFQCKGDTNGDIEGTLTKYRVYTNDLNRLKENWSKKLTQNPNPCADIDHAYEGSLTKYRVYTNDLNRLKANWAKKVTQINGNVAPCPVVDTARWL